MKYIVEFEDEPCMYEDEVYFYKCIQAPWWGLSERVIERLTPYQPDHTADIGKKVERDRILKEQFEHFDELGQNFDDSGIKNTQNLTSSGSGEGKHDLISRQAALEAMGKAKWAKERLMELPSAQPEVLAHGEGELIAQSEPHWIPCGERLPEEKQSVLVTDGSVVWVCDIISTDEGYKWEDSHGYWLDLDEWTAWMSLPKPTGGDME